MLKNADITISTANEYPYVQIHVTIDVSLDKHLQINVKTIGTPKPNP